MSDPDIVDIVTMLRSPDRFEPYTCNAAADEIERLREELRLANIDNFNTTAEVDRLRAERDEVRQSYCSLMEAYRGGDGRVTANKLGWGYLFPRRPKKEDGK